MSAASRVQTLASRFASVDDAARVSDADARSTPVKRRFQTRARLKPPKASSRSTEPTVERRRFLPALGGGAAKRRPRSVFHARAPARRRLTRSRCPSPPRCVERFTHRASPPRGDRVVATPRARGVAAIGRTSAPAAPDRSTLDPPPDRRGSSRRAPPPVASTRARSSELTVRVPLPRPSPPKRARVASLRRVRNSPSATPRSRLAKRTRSSPRRSRRAARRASRSRAPRTRPVSRASARACKTRRGTSSSSKPRWRA